MLRRREDNNYGWRVQIIGFPPVTAIVAPEI